jgi:hypothetical protein
MVCDDPDMAPQSTPFSDMSEKEQNDLLNTLSMLTEEQLANYFDSLVTFLTEEELQDFVDWLSADEDLYGAYVRQVGNSVPFSAMTEEQKQVYAEVTAALSIEQLYANLQAVYTFTTTDNLQVYTEWLQENELMP